MKYFLPVKLLLAFCFLMFLFVPVAHWAIDLNAYVAETTIELATISPVKLIASYPEKALPLLMVYCLPLLLTLLARSKLGASALLKNACHLVSLAALAFVSGYMRFCVAVADPLIGAYIGFAVVGLLAVMEFVELWGQ